MELFDWDFTGNENIGFATLELYALMDQIARPGAAGATFLASLAPVRAAYRKLCTATGGDEGRGEGVRSEEGKAATAVKGGRGVKGERGLEVMRGGDARQVENVQGKEVGVKLREQREEAHVSKGKAAVCSPQVRVSLSFKHTEVCGFGFLFHMCA